MLNSNWEPLPDPPQSPDLSPSDYHLFGPLNPASDGLGFEDYDAVKTLVHKKLL